MQRHKHAEKNLFMNRASWAQVHRHLLDLFPLTWGRHLAIQSPPSLYQQEGALRRCCSSEPVQLDTKYCRESLSFTPAGREKKKKREYYSSSDRTPALLLLSPTFPPGWAGGWKCMCVWMCRSRRMAHITGANTGHNATTRCTARQSVRKMAEALKCTVNNRHALDLNRKTIFKYY